MSKELLIPAVTSYLRAGADQNLIPVFEAAHSVTLALFSAPQNTDVTIENIPLYVDLLFKAFPTNVSARQFRLAYKALLVIASPPSRISELQPMLSAILLDVLSEAFRTASTAPIPPDPNSPEAALEDPGALSAQAVILLTLIDTFTQIPLPLLDEWLPLAADLLHEVHDARMQDVCREHFWQAFVGGAMDPERSRLCHAWWSTGGGRERVLDDREEGEEQTALMSGALPNEAIRSKL